VEGGRGGITDLPAIYRICILNSKGSHGAWLYTLCHKLSADLYYGALNAFANIVS
jgi:hypothetical protein